METVRICCSAATYSTIQAIFFFSLGFRLQIHCCETKRGRQVLAATSTRLLDWSALNFNIGLLCTTSCRSRTHSFFNLGSHGHERLFYICGILCTGFQKRNSKRICKFLQIEKQWTVSSCTGWHLTSLPGAPLDNPRVPGSHPTAQCQSEEDLQSRGHSTAPICGTGTSVHDKPEQGLSQAHTGAPTYLCCCIVYYFLCGQITLVPHQQLVDVFTGITVYLLQPLLDIIERLLRDKRTVSKALDKEESSALSLWSWPGGRVGSTALIYVIHNHGRGRSNAAQLPQWPRDRPLLTGAIQLLFPALHNQPFLHASPCYFSLLHILTIQHLLPSGTLPAPPVAEIRDMAHSWNQMHPTYWQSIRY